MIACTTCCERIFDSPESLQNHLDLQAGKLTDRAVTAILDAVRKGKGPLQAARVAGVPAEVWAKEIKSNTVLQDALKLAEIEFSEQIEEALAEQALNKDFNSQKLWLERRSEDKWAPTPNKVEVNIIESIKTLPLAERKERLLEMLEARVLADPNIIDGEIVDD